MANGEMENLPEFRLKGASALMSAPYLWSNKHGVKCRIDVWERDSHNEFKRVRKAGIKAKML